MFGSTTPFGQSPSTRFGSPSMFGQTNNPGTNPFASKPFGSPSPFGSQMGSSIFGTSTGVFGQPSGAPAFGASSSPAFGASSSSPFGSNSLFGQKPAFGGFGSTPNQSSPFGSTFQQTQSTFGSSPFGFTTFSASSRPAFGASSTPDFGSSSAPAFGAASTPAFGATSTPAFGSTSTSAFGSTPTPLFCNTGTAFGVSIAPAFGSTATPAFGSQSTSLFGSSVTPAFGAASTPAFGSSSTPAFGASSNPSFSFGSTPSPGQTAFGVQPTTPTFGSQGFGQTCFGGQQGSRLGPYSATQDADIGGKLSSISAMPAYKDESHEELRCEDYQRGDKGGANFSGQPTSSPAPAQANPFGSTSTFGQPAANPAQANPFGSTSTFGQSSANPYSSATPSNLFAPKTQPFAYSGIGTSSPSPFSSTFGSSPSNLFSSTTSTTSSFGVPTNSAFGASSSSIFSGTTSAFSSPSTFGSTAGPSSTFSSGMNFGNTQSSGLFQSSTTSMGQTPSPFGQPTGFQQTTPAFGSNLFRTPSTGFGGTLFSSSASISSMSNPVSFGLATPSLSTPFQSSVPAQTSSAFSSSNFEQTQSAPSGGFGGSFNICSPGTFDQSAATQTNMVMQPAPVTNPFGILPSMPQMSIGHISSAPSVQHGISSMAVSEKPVPVKISSLLGPRHLSQRKIRLPARKYHPKLDGQRVPFFSDDETAAVAAAPKADARFMPRENPRSLIIRPIEQWPLRTKKEEQSKDSSANGNGQSKVSGEMISPVQDETSPKYRNVSSTENGHAKEQNNAHSLSSLSSSSSTTEKANGVPRDKDNHAAKGTDLSDIEMSGNRTRGAAAIVCENGAGIEALMPILRHADYYTEPQIQELAAKERAEPGFCCRVKDFVVGRCGFGSIKFLGETDVRSIDLESILELNNREVTVYKEGSKKPQIGQGLNKPAEVTLLNIKCINKRTGVPYTAGSKVEMYKEMLIKKAREQDAEFVSYDAVKGEWKFRVRHFSSYEFQDGDTDVSIL